MPGSHAAHASSLAHDPSRMHARSLVRAPSLLHAPSGSTAPIARVLLAVTAAAMVVLFAASLYIGVEIVRDVIPQVGAVGVGDLDVGYLLGASWTANGAFLVALAASGTALVVTRRARRARPAHAV